MDRGAWQATICGTASSLTQLSNYKTNKINEIKKHLINKLVSKWLFSLFFVSESFYIIKNLWGYNRVSLSCRIWLSLILLGRFRSFIGIHIIDTQFKFTFMILFSICLIWSIFFSLLFSGHLLYWEFIISFILSSLCLMNFTWFAHFQ